MTKTILIDDLVKIPFIDANNIGRRILTTLTFFDDDKWQTWIPSPKGLIPIKTIPIEADYFARKKEKETDIYFEFLNFMTQHTCWEKIICFVDGIRNDIHNLGASLQKLEIFHQMYGNKTINVTRFVSTEIEYIVGVCRSIFDLLQEIIATLWHDYITLTDKTIRKKQLKKSFSDMVLSNNNLRSCEEIKSQFNIPSELASFYHRNGPFFQKLRKCRDSIIHSGKCFGLIFVTEKGFAVFDKEEPFASFGVWNNEHMLPNNLASLRPVVAHLIIETINSCKDFCTTIQKIIKFPSEIVPGFKLFIRGHHNSQLIALREVLENCSWWN